jgi:hypothetical protein
LDLGRSEIVLESKKATHDLGGISEERVSQRRHAPMQPDSLVAGNAGEQRHGSIPKCNTFGWNTAPDSQDDSSSLGPGLLARQLFLQVLIQKGAQFSFIGRFHESTQHGINPCSL